MKDNEIIKALECCLEDIADCENCPYENPCSIHKNDMLTDILNLIWRQKSKIEALTMDKTQLESDIINANMNLEYTEEQLSVTSDLCRKQGTEIENLKIELQAMRGAANSYKAEIEELAKYKHDYYVLKAEAYKEFAEMANSLGYSVMLGGKYGYEVITKEGIVYILKKLLEGNGNA